MSRTRNPIIFREYYHRNSHFKQVHIETVKCIQISVYTCRSKSLLICMYSSSHRNSKLNERIERSVWFFFWCSKATCKLWNVCQTHSFYLSLFISFFLSLPTDICGFVNECKWKIFATWFNTTGMQIKCIAAAEHFQCCFCRLFRFQRWSIQPNEQIKNELRCLIDLIGFFYKVHLFLCDEIFYTFCTWMISNH